MSNFTSMAKHGTDLSTKVELMLSARSLADMDVFSKSDPICVVYELRDNPHQFQYGGEPSFVEVGRTSCIANTLNPNWSEKFQLNYFFESKQMLKFEVYDVDSNSRNLAEHDFLGDCTCLLADIVAAPNGTLVLKLSVKGNLIVRADELDEGQKESVYFVCHGRNLDKKNWFSKSSPFLEFYRLLSDGSRQLIHRTEVVKKSHNPEWKPFELPVRHLCQGKKDKEFLIECYAFQRNGSCFSHKLIGAVCSTVNKITSQPSTNLSLINVKKQRKNPKKYKNSGVLHFLDVQLRKEFSFLDFISAGLQLDFGVAIDFTASNGLADLPNSLHFINTTAGTYNQYEASIHAILDICQSYNRKKIFEATGFGAKISPHHEVSHIFPLNLTDFLREVHGVEGVLSFYRTALHLIEFYGPTNFEPTIRDYSMKLRQLPKNSGRYQILLIITDGIITDMGKTKSAIVEASDLPLFIIIVGVGMHDFEKMDELDSDNRLLRSMKGRMAKRDIVQFVAMNKFFRAHAMPQNFDEYARIQSALAKELLQEVPLQVTSYMKSVGVTPSMLESSIMPKSASASLAS